MRFVTRGIDLEQKGNRMGRHSRKALIVMLSGLLATSMLAALPAAASAVEGPDLSSGLATSEAPVTKKTVTVYDGDESKKQDFDCLFRDDMPNVPYVDVEQYLELVVNDTDFVMTQSGGQFSYHGEIGDKKGATLP